MKNAHDNFSVLELLPAAARTASANGTGVDIREYVGKAKVLLMSSDGGGTSPTLDVKIQDSDDNSSFTDVSGAAFTQVTDAADSTEEIGLQVDGLKRYIRAVATIGGSDTPTFSVGVAFVGRQQVV